MQLNADVCAAFATFGPTSISPSVVTKPECISSGTMATMHPSGCGSTPPSAKGLLSRRDMRSIARRGPTLVNERKQGFRAAGIFITLFSRLRRSASDLSGSPSLESREIGGLGFAWPVLDHCTTALWLSLSLSLSSFSFSLSGLPLRVSLSESLSLSLSLPSPLALSVSLSLPLSVSLSLSPSICLSLSLPLSVSLSLSIFSFCLPLSLYVSLSLSISLSPKRILSPRNESLALAKAGAVLEDQLRRGRCQKRLGLNLGGLLTRELVISSGVQRRVSADIRTGAAVIECAALSKTQMTQQQGEMMKVITSP